MQEMRAGYLKERDPSISRLVPQVKYWEEDLPEKYEQHPTTPQLICVNEINETWMDIPRYENIWWGGLWLFSIISLFPIPFIFILIFVPGFSDPDFKFSLIMLIFMFVFFSMALLWFRMALFVPRGTPVRFNRKRQKVYVYEHQRSNWNPWSRWPTVIKVFDWTDIHGEMVRQVGRYESGHRLSCAVCKRGTYEVVDRFILSWTEGDSRVIRSLWSHCCQYMLYKPVPEKPLLLNAPWSWCPRNNTFWPEALNKESTTALDEE